MKHVMAFFILTCVFFGVSHVGAGQFSDEESLKGLSSVKVFFDVNVDIPEKLILRLRLINRTFEELKAAGMKPVFVVGFRGGATTLVTQGTDYYEESELPSKKRITNWVKNLKNNGLVLEQCAVAVELFEVEPKDILPEIKVVGNGYISMIGYQNRGYAFVPMD